MTRVDGQKEENMEKEKEEKENRKIIVRRDGIKASMRVPHRPK